MTEQAQGQPTPEEQGNRPEASPEPLFVARTQKDLDAKFGAEKKIAAKSATEAERARILQSLGVESEEDLSGIVTTHREVEAATSTEADKANARAQKLETTLSERQSELDEAYSRIATLSEDAALRDAFSETTLKAGKLKAAMRLVDRDALDVDDDGNLTGVAEQVAAVQKDVPELFEPEKPERPTRLGSGSSPGPQNGSDSLRGFDKVASFLGNKYGG